MTKELYADVRKARIKQVTENKVATGAELLDTIKEELHDLSVLITKRTNRMVLEAAIDSNDYDEIKNLLIQLLCNISMEDKPLYLRDEDALSIEGTRLFYSMPATVFCLFNLRKDSALADFQIKNPSTKAELNRNEFITWQLTRRNAEHTDKDKIDYMNEMLKQYGFEPLDEKNHLDYLAITLLSSAQNSDTLPTARKQLCKIMRFENEQVAAKRKIKTDLYDK